MELTGVFILTDAIEEIGAEPGDRIVVRPHGLRPGLLQRTVEPCWAFDPRSLLVFTRPAVEPQVALHLLRDRLRARRARHRLRLL